jgi:hypothetical protein
MKVYLTQQGKEELEAEINRIQNTEDPNSECRSIATDIYQKILSSAIILPTEYGNVLLKKQEG